jgi:hypothetical protein
MVCLVPIRVIVDYIEGDDHACFFCRSCISLRNLRLPVAFSGSSTNAIVPITSLQFPGVLRVDYYDITISRSVLG